AEFLLSKEANVNAQNRNGITPLMSAASKGTSPLLTLLMAHDANPFLTTQAHDTAHDLAAQNEESQTCQLLQNYERDYWDRHNRKGTLMSLLPPRLVEAMMAQAGGTVSSGPTSHKTSSRKRSTTNTSTSATSSRRLTPTTSQSSLSSSSQATTPLQYDPELLHTTVVELLHENQRSSYLSPRAFTPANLARGDAAPWTTHRGHPCSREEVNLPVVRDTATGEVKRGWFWMGEWKVDTKGRQVDRVEGWQYARSFAVGEEEWSPEVPLGLVGSWVRRRWWIRVRRKRIDVVEQDGSLRAGEAGAVLDRTTSGASLTAASSVLTAQGTYLDRSREQLSRLKPLLADRSDPQPTALATFVSTTSTANHAEARSATVPGDLDA
ncbi:hypothetical protein HDU93_005838, partial [Gonapodya sp. JEL0774]